MESAFALSALGKPSTFEIESIVAFRTESRVAFRWRSASAAAAIMSESPPATIRLVAESIDTAEVQIFPTPWLER
jgi:hypothetical protein